MLGGLNKSVYRAWSLIYVASTHTLVSVSSVISLLWSRKQCMNAQVIGGKQSIASQKWLRNYTACCCTFFPPEEFVVLVS